MWPCCGLCGSAVAVEGDEEEQQPLLAHYDGQTALQRKIQEKLHTCQMGRALMLGYLPSNDQLVANLRTMMSSDVLNPENSDLSDPGRALVSSAKQLTGSVAGLLQRKNGNNQIQDFVHCMARAHISVDTTSVAQAASRALPSMPKGDAKTAYTALKTLGSLLLTNNEFRLFLSDLNTVARQVLEETAFNLSNVSKQAGKQIAPPKVKEDALLKKAMPAVAPPAPPTETGDNAPSPPTSRFHEPSTQDLKDEVALVGDIFSKSAGQVAGGLQDSITAKASGPEKEALIARLKSAVADLRQRPDYTGSVSTLSVFANRLAATYTHVSSDLAETVSKDVLHANQEADEAMKNFWGFMSSFGDAKEWDGVEAHAKAVMAHSKDDAEFGSLLSHAGDLVHKMMLDPGFYDGADAKLGQLRSDLQKAKARSSLLEEVDGLFGQLGRAAKSAAKDEDVKKVQTHASRIGSLLNPTGDYFKKDLFGDAINVFLPLIMKALKHIPIPRLEISNKEFDILIEALVLEPSNRTSFSPSKFRVEMHNNFEARQQGHAGAPKASTRSESLITLSLAGLSVCADDIGFWVRLHKGRFCQFTDQGVAGFSLGDKGMDIELDVEIGHDSLEHLIALKAVRVKVHTLTYWLRGSKLACLAWCFKPLVTYVAKRVVENKVAEAIGAGLMFMNREAVFARERLRATRVANPDDFKTFVKAIGSRMTPKEDGDVWVRLGVDEAGEGPFKGIYTPGSIVKVWHEEEAKAKTNMDQYSRGGWRNGIFDVPVVQA